MLVKQHTSLKKKKEKERKEEGKEKKGKEKAGMVANTWNSYSEESKTDPSLGLTGQPA